MKAMRVPRLFDNDPNAMESWSVFSISIVFILAALVGLVIAVGTDLLFGLQLYIYIHGVMGNPGQGAGFKIILSAGAAILMFPINVIISVYFSRLFIMAGLFGILTSIIFCIILYTTTGILGTLDFLLGLSNGISMGSLTGAFFWLWLAQKRPDGFTRVIFGRVASEAAEEGANAAFAEPRPLNAIILFLPIIVLVILWQNLYWII